MFYYLVALFVPPVAVALTGRPYQVIVNILLMLLLVFPAVLHAIAVVREYYRNGGQDPPKAVRNLVYALAGIGFVAAFIIPKLSPVPPEEKFEPADIWEMKSYKCRKAREELADEILSYFIEKGLDADAYADRNGIVIHFHREMNLESCSLMAKLVVIEVGSPKEWRCVPRVRCEGNNYVGWAFLPAEFLE